MSPHFGMLILGHGTPEPRGQEEFLELLPLVRQQAGAAALEAGFLEFASPTVAEALAALAAAGARRIAAVPVFLAAAGHVARDIPPALSAAARSRPRVQIELKPHVGSHRNVAALSALRYHEALEGLPEVPAAETLLLLAAHGSPEPEAFSTWSNFAEDRAKSVPGLCVEPCFAVLGRPQLADVLPPLLKKSFRRIVVQPHLLLHGRLYDNVCHAVEPYRNEYPDKEWIVTQPLGIHPLLAEAVVDLAMNEGREL
ncbi:MAG: hypothetical protein JXB10_20015 [Pirellulales bacterium]|nr:hypothetical protein [Pirellulales bacterium]